MRRRKSPDTVAADIAGDEKLAREDAEETRFTLGKKAILARCFSYRTFGEKEDSKSKKGYLRFS